MSSQCTPSPDPDATGRRPAPARAPAAGDLGPPRRPAPAPRLPQPVVRAAAACAGWWWAAKTWWGGRPRAARDRELAFVFTVLSFTEPLAGSVGAQFGDLPTRHAPVLAVLLTLGQTVPLVLRTSRPALCLALVGLSFAAHQSLGLPQTFGSLGLYVALYSVGANADRRRRLLVVPAVAAYVVFCVVLHRLGSPQRLPDWVVIGLVLAAFWTAGTVVRGREAAGAERRRLAELAATAAERSRLARELHDVVTHHVTAMVVQSDAAPFLMDAPERVTEALAAISGTGRRALAELRYLLGVLEATGEAAPDGRAPARGDLRDLVEQARMGGHPAELVEEGERAPLPIGAELAVYRLVQESLTNAVKHAPGRRTRVTVGHHRQHVEVDVSNDGPGEARWPDEVAPTAPGREHLSGGRGLRGLRTRVDMLGGTFAAGPRGDGGFSVRARIPTRGDA